MHPSDVPFAVRVLSLQLRVRSQIGIGGICHRISLMHWAQALVLIHRL